jgi:hypothetical protein
VASKAADLNQGSSLFYSITASLTALAIAAAESLANCL